MRDGHSSLTALFVAVGRGVGTRASNVDRGAPAVMPASIGAPLHAVQRLGRLAAPARLFLRVASAGLVDHVCLRTGAIDSALADGIARGCRQLVVLGAGLDARAFRLSLLAEVDVFEVDHPDTQAEKRRRVDGSRALARSMRFVPVDFERESVADRLAEAGHDANVPTFWIWEGVTPYLEPAAITATLEDLGERSTKDSELAMTYGLPELPLPHALHGAVYSVFAVLGEPLLGLMSTRAAAEAVQQIGFTVLDDTGSIDWATRFPGHAKLARPFSSERLVVARKTAG
jgi:methyltransferase (TIGR00027 family)